MRRAFSVAAAAFTLALPTAIVSPASAAVDQDSAEPVTVSMVVEPAPGEKPRSMTMDVAPAMVDTTVESLKAHPAVLSAGRQQIYHSMGDTHTSKQWGRVKTRADRLNPSSNGAGIIVAVLDTGVQASHEDLAPVLSGGRPRVINDRDWDCILSWEDPGCPSPYPWSLYDNDGHGTHTAGIISAKRDNSRGIAGIAPEAQILSYRVLDDEGAGYDEDIALAIHWAWYEGADVINLSLGGTKRSAVVADAIQYVTTNTQTGKLAPAVVVAAAGNFGTHAAVWPAADDRVIAVGATDINDQPAPYSSRGSWVDLAAPGTSILSTVPGGYAFMSGTSMAAPHTSAAAALLRQQTPSLTPTQVQAKLQSAAHDIALLGRDAATGYGRLDIAAAINPSRWPKVPRPPFKPTGRIDPIVHSGGSFRVSGRAVDKDGTTSVWLTRTVGTQSSRVKVAAPSGYFSASFPAAKGTTTICATALDYPSASITNGVNLGCQQIVVK